MLPLFFHYELLKKGQFCPRKSYGRSGILVLLYKSQVQTLYLSIPFAASASI